MMLFKTRPRCRKVGLCTARIGLASARRLHDGGIWGYQIPQELVLPDFTPKQLRNRATQPELVRLVDMYRRHAHRAASLDPLGLTPRPPVPALDPRRYGFSLSPSYLSSLPATNLSDVLPDGPPLEHLGNEEKAWETEGVVGMREPDEDEAEGRKRTLGDIVRRLEEIYCGKIGYEYMHMPNKHAREWFALSLESLPHSAPTSTDSKRRYWSLLSRSERFDRWLAKKFPNVKRYGLEGGEAMLVALDRLWTLAQESGVKESVVTMPHRGRLNFLTQLLDYDLPLLMRKLRGKSELPDEFVARGATGDVLSHLFCSTSLPSSNHPNPIRVHLLPNPSHLEAVAPVGLGFARGLQVPLGCQAEEGGLEEGGYELGRNVLSVQVHGDAAFGGQGVVSETLQLSSLPHFNVGGSVHLVVNNQLGYTTSAIQGRSSFYATDLGKGIGAPVIHVNGENPEAVARAMGLAFAYQQKFRKDVLVDLMVYRRWGHNELDEPSFTSPLMYQKIVSLKSVPAIYQTLLLEAGTITQQDVDGLESTVGKELDDALEKADAGYEAPPPPMKDQWHTVSFSGPGVSTEDVSPNTGAASDRLIEVGRASVKTPEGFNVHPRLVRTHMQKRLQSLENGQGIDFATAEALAFGTLLQDGNNVRLCGQDSGRGTFSQRHALLADQEVEGRSIVPLNTALQAKGRLEVVNSPLSEFAVMGFEVGVSWTTPTLLPLWEAQFGDFANGAQIILDTFFASSEAKWLMQSALTLVLPHGYDGAGPEHSSGRIERFLQLSSEPAQQNEDWTPNCHVCNPTTPAQLFHLLRRQLVRPYRKPLVVFSPKGILRLPAASSSLSEMEEGTTWRPVLDDPSLQDAAKEKVERVVICSGKTYYDLAKKREGSKLSDRVALVRLEELSPFPYDAVQELLSSYPTDASVMWAQEEPENCGPLTFVLPKLQQAVGDRQLLSISRPPLATAAIGVGTVFKAEQARYEASVFEGL